MSPLNSSKGEIRPVSYVLLPSSQVSPKKASPHAHRRVVVCAIASASLLACLVRMHFLEGNPFKGPEPPLWRACTQEGKDGFPFCDVSLPAHERLNDLVGRIDLKHAAWQLTARESTAIEELGLPAYYWGTNAIHGLQNVECLANGICPTAFPAPVNYGATFDMDLAYEMATILGDELRAYYNGQLQDALDVWSPTINIQRDPRWGRNAESPGEDPLLAGLFGIAYTRGVQEGPEYPRVTKVAVTLKHWFAYNLEQYRRSNRFSFNAIISAFDLGDTYLPAWEMVVKQAKPLGIMCSFNRVNGVPSCGNPDAYKTLQDWGFDGYITSDTGACEYIYTKHQYAATPEDGVRICLQGDTHINSGRWYKEYLKSALEKGVVNETLVKHALYKSYETRLRLGLFDAMSQKKLSYDEISTDIVGSKANVEHSIKAARKSMILLQNEQSLLPLPKGKHVAVIGRSSNGTADLLGNYFGPVCPGKDKKYSCVTTVYQRVSQLNHGGRTTLSNNLTDVAAAVKVAEAADYVVYTISSLSDVQGEGKDRESIALDANQQRMFDAVVKVGKPVVLVVISFSIIALEDIVDRVPAIIQAFSPGAHGAIAIAETVFGDINPGGKLPMTLYPSGYVDEVDFEDMSMTNRAGRTYRYYTGKPTFPFGFGISYTTFDITWDDRPNCTFSGSLAEKCRFGVKVKNTGNIVGDEVVQVYIAPVKKSLAFTDAQVPVPMKQLVFFKRVSLSPGNFQVVDVGVAAREIGLVDAQGDRYLQPGDYNLIVSRGHGNTLQTSLRVSAKAPVLLQKLRHKWW